MDDERPNYAMSIESDSGELCERCPNCDRRYMDLYRINGNRYCERCKDDAEKIRASKAAEAATHQ